MDEYICYASYFFFKERKKSSGLRNDFWKFPWEHLLPVPSGRTAAQDLCCRECRDPSGVGPVSLVGPKTPPVDQQLRLRDV